MAVSRRISARSRSGSVGEAGVGGFAGQLLVERDLPPQDAVENVGGDPSGGEAGDFRLRRGARSRHNAIIATNCGWRAKGTEKTSVTHRFKPAGGVRNAGKIICILLQIVLARIGRGALDRTMFPIT